MKLNEILTPNKTYIFDKTPYPYIELKLITYKKRTKQSLEKLDIMTRKFCDEHSFKIIRVNISNETKYYKVLIELSNHIVDIDEVLTKYAKSMFETFQQFLSISSVSVFVFMPMVNKITCMNNQVNLQITGTPNELKGIIKTLDCKVLNIMDFKKFKGGLLSLFDMKQLQFVKTGYQGFEVIKIMNKHLLGNRDILECQEEMITNGFKEYARL